MNQTKFGSARRRTLWPRLLFEGAVHGNGPRNLVRQTVTLPQQAKQPVVRSFFIKKHLRGQVQLGQAHVRKHYGSATKSMPVSASLRFSARVGSVNR